jgi:hypothetical protein
MKKKAAEELEGPQKKKVKLDNHTRAGVVPTEIVQHIALCTQDLRSVAALVQTRVELLTL